MTVGARWPDYRTGSFQYELEGYPSVSIDSRYRRLYGLSEVEYDAQCEFQQDRCAVCGEQNPLRSDGSRLRLAVDHDHVSNEYRELLCDRCNKTLGFVRDSRKLLLQLAEYLKRHRRDDTEEQSQGTLESILQTCPASVPKLPFNLPQLMFDISRLIVSRTVQKLIVRTPDVTKQTTPLSSGPASPEFAHRQRK